METKIYAIGDERYGTDLISMPGCAGLHRPGAQFELAAIARGGDIDSGRRQPLDVLVTSLGVDSVDGLLAALEAVLNERKQHPILIIMVVEKRADMTWRAKY
jgi:hypothetical protein